MEKQGYRSADEVESVYLQKIAQKDAWANLNQWFFPALGLSLLALAYWLYRLRLHEVLQGSSSEFRILINLIFIFFVVLLHLALLLYIIKLLRMLKHFSGPYEPHCAFYTIEGEPRCTLNLIFTSRSDLRRYRWHYYLSELPITPLPKQRKVLPLFVQKKSWMHFGNANREQSEEPEEQLLEAFSDHPWLLLCQECRQSNSKLRLQIAELQYHDFQFYYLCGIDRATGKNAQQLAAKLQELQDLQEREGQSL